MIRMTRSNRLTTKTNEIDPCTLCRRGSRMIENEKSTIIIIHGCFWSKLISSLGQEGVALGATKSSAYVPLK